jgi:hypothetical protein
MSDKQTDGDWQHWQRLERDLWISDCRVRRPEPRHEFAVRVHHARGLVARVLEITGLGGSLVPET